MTDAAAGLTLTVREQPFDRTVLELVDEQGGARTVATSLTIDELALSDGRGGSIRAGGIGNVETLETHRRRGLASALLRIAIERMRDAGHDASLLYGIDDFYDRLGWRSCGDERWVRIMRAPQLATDIVSRAAQSTDINAIRDIYDAAAAVTPGAVLRPRDGRAWSNLDPEQVLVAERAGAVTGYAWRWTEPDHAELHAADDDAMLELVAAVCSHASLPVTIGAPEQHPLRRLARAERLWCELVDEVRPAGGAMLLPFTARGDLPSDLYQYRPDRF